jgi:hypothetical protein
MKNFLSRNVPLCTAPLLLLLLLLLLCRSLRVMTATTFSPSMASGHPTTTASAIYRERESGRGERERVGEEGEWERRERESEREWERRERESEREWERKRE